MLQSLLTFSHSSLTWQKKSSTFPVEKENNSLTPREASGIPAAPKLQSCILPLELSLGPAWYARDSCPCRHWRPCPVTSHLLCTQTQPSAKFLALFRAHFCLLLDLLAAQPLQRSLPSTCNKSAQPYLTKSQLRQNLQAGQGQLRELLKMEAARSHSLLQQSPPSSSKVPWPSFKCSQESSNDPRGCFQKV